MESGHSSSFRQTSAATQDTDQHEDRHTADAQDNADDHGMDSSSGDMRAPLVQHAAFEETSPHAVNHAGQYEYDSREAHEARSTCGECRANGRAVLLTLIACAGAVLFGFHIGFSSPTYDDVKRDAGLTTSQTDLVFSVLAVGAMGGALVAGKVADAVGRRRALMMAALPLGGGAAVFALCVSFAGLLTGRVITGFGVGYCTAVVPLYITEIAPSSLRGTLGTVNQLLVAGGILLVNAAGFPSLEHPHYWKALMLLSLVFVAVLFFGMLLVGVETPSWLIARGREADALAALRKLRGRHAAVQDELRAMVSEHEEAAAEGGELTLGEQLRSLGRRENLRPFVVAVLVTLTQQWSGINAVVFNTKVLFEGDDPAKDRDGNVETSTARDALVGAVLANLVQVIFTGVSAAYSERRGRRFFLLISAAGLAVTNGALGLAYGTEAAEAIKVVLVAAFYAFFAIGLGPITWIMASEVFPRETRGLLVSLVTLINWLSAFLVTLSFNSMKDTLGDDGTFYSYAVVAAVGGFLIHLFVPETKGRTLEEVAGLFQGGWRWRGAPPPAPVLHSDA